MKQQQAMIPTIEMMQVLDDAVDLIDAVRVSFSPANERKAEKILAAYEKVKKDALAQVQPEQLEKSDDQQVDTEYTRNKTQ